MLAAWRGERQPPPPPPPLLPPAARPRARMLAETVYTILLYARLYLSSLVSRVGIFYFGFVLVETTMTTFAFLDTVTLIVKVGDGYHNGLYLGGTLLKSPSGDHVSCVPSLLNFIKKILSFSFKYSILSARTV